MASRLVHSSSSRGLSSSPTPPLPNQHHHQNHNHTGDGLLAASGPEPRNGLEADEVDKSAPVPYLPQLVVLCEQRHEPEGIDEAAARRALHQWPRLQVAPQGSGNGCDADCRCRFF